MPIRTIRTSVVEGGGWGEGGGGGGGGGDGCEDGEEGGPAPGGEKNHRSTRTPLVLFLWETRQDSVRLSLSVTMAMGPGSTVTLSASHTSAGGQTRTCEDTRDEGGMCTQMHRSAHMHTQRID